MQGTSRGQLCATRGRPAAVTETEPTFRDDLLATVPLDELFTLPVATLADRWRA